MDIHYPHCVLYPVHKLQIPYPQSVALQSGLCNLYHTHTVSLPRFYLYLEDIKRMIQTNQLGILPPKLPYYAKMFYFQNQKSRWAFKKLLHMYHNKHAHTNMFNTECLEGRELRYSPTYPPRRTMCLWDQHSRRSYVFSINDILGIFRACILQEEIHPPKNPYTNIPFTQQQLRKIHMFLQYNRDRFQPEDEVLLTYTRWHSVRIAYDHITKIRHTIQPRLPLDNRVIEEPMIASMLWESILDTDTVCREKLPIAEELQTEFFKQIYYEFTTNCAFVPTTKVGHYVHTILTTHDDPGSTLRKWHNTNRRRFTLRSNIKQTE